MSYLALARKYRPQTFSEVLSQEFITSTLKNAITLGRVSHAYLFTGPRGVGKTSTARIFAKALNCLNPQENASPCGECENCLDITNGTSLDVIEIDGASNRGVEEIRSLREAVKFVPVKSKYKVIIVDEVHMLTEQAFNALLKTLEEPPEYVIFIFATTDQHKIPVTILSRSQRYEFKKITYDEMSSNLENILNIENVTYEKDALNFIIRNSDGCMRDALSLLDQVIAYSGANIKVEDTLYLLGITDSYLANNLFSAVLQENVEVIPEIVMQIDEKGIDFKYMVECLIEHTRNMLFLSYTNKLPSSHMTTQEIEYYNNLKEYGDTSRLYGLFQIFQKLVNDLKYSDFAKYVFEFAMFKAASLSSIIPLLTNENTVSEVKAKDSIKPNNIAHEKQEVIKAEVKAQVKEVPHKEIKEEIKQEEVKKENNDSGIWTRVLNMVHVKEQMLYGLLQCAKVVKDTPEHLVISFPNDRQFQYKNVKNGRMRDTFENIVWIVTEKNTKIDVELSNDIDTEKKTENIEKKTEEITNYTENSSEKKQTIKINQVDSLATQKLKEELKENQFIQAAIRELGSEIIKIEKS